METGVKITAMIIGAVLVLALIGGIVYWKTNSAQNTINVQGSAVLKAMPDLVKVYVSAETSAKSAQEAKDNNSIVVDKVITGLVARGFDRSKITTENYNIYPEYDWTNGKQVLRGYKASQSIKVELSAEKIDDAGEVADISVDAGALISYINFELSNEKQNAYKADALKKAGEDARTKAESMALGVGKKLGDVVSVSELTFNYAPWNVYSNAGRGIAEESLAVKSATNIQPGSQEINAQVSVVFEIV